MSPVESLMRFEIERRRDMKKYTIVAMILLYTAASLALAGGRRESEPAARPFGRGGSAVPSPLPSAHGSAPPVPMPR